jgi:hypothetical protein
MKVIKIINNGFLNKCSYAFVYNQIYKPDVLGYQFFSKLFDRPNSKLKINSFEDIIVSQRE